MNNNKTIAKNTLYLYFRMMVIIAINLFAVRIILKVLGIEDYGIYNVVGGIVYSKCIFLAAGRVIGEFSPQSDAASG